MDKKNISLSIEEARALYGKSTEMDLLLLTTFTKEELTKKEITCWEDLKSIKGFYVDSDARIRPIMAASANSNNKGVFVTEKQAKSVIAMAQLSQLLKEYNGDWVPNWESTSNKYVIKRSYKTCLVDSYCNTYYFLTFQTRAEAERFYDFHRLLIHQYYQLD